MTLMQETAKQRRKTQRKRSTAGNTAAPPSIEGAYAGAIARAIIAVTASMGSAGGVTMRALVNFLRGSSLPPAGGPAPGEGFGILETHRAGWVEEAIGSLVEAGYVTLVPPMGRRGLRLDATPEGRAFLDEGSALPPGIFPAAPRLGAHPEVEERLRELRRKLAAREGCSPYIVFPNTALATLAAERPGTLAELASVAGMGEARVRKYGRKILEAIRKPEE